jgi:hypothetical protein
LTIKIAARIPSRKPEEIPSAEGDRLVQALLQTLVALRSAISRLDPKSEHGLEVEQIEERIGRLRELRAIPEDNETARMTGTEAGQTFPPTNDHTRLREALKFIRCGTGSRHIRVSLSAAKKKEGCADERQNSVSHVIGRWALLSTG